MIFQCQNKAKCKYSDIKFYITHSNTIGLNWNIQFGWNVPEFPVPYTLNKVQSIK